MRLPSAGFIQDWKMWLKWNALQVVHKDIIFSLLLRTSFINFMQIYFKAKKALRDVSLTVSTCKIKPRLPKLFDLNKTTNFFDVFVRRWLVFSSTIRDQCKVSRQIYFLLLSFELYNFKLSMHYQISSCNAKEEISQPNRQQRTLGILMVPIRMLKRQRVI